MRVILWTTLTLLALFGVLVVAFWDPDLIEPPWDLPKPTPAKSTPRLLKGLEQDQKDWEVAQKKDSTYRVSLADRIERTAREDALRDVESGIPRLLICFSTDERNKRYIDLMWRRFAVEVVHVDCSRMPAAKSVYMNPYNDVAWRSLSSVYGRDFWRRAARAAGVEVISNLKEPDSLLE